MDISISRIYFIIRLKKKERARYRWHHAKSLLLPVHKRFLALVTLKFLRLSLPTLKQGWLQPASAFCNVNICVFFFFYHNHERWMRAYARLTHGARRKLGRSRRKTIRAMRMAREILFFLLKGHVSIIPPCNSVFSFLFFFYFRQAP